MKNRILSIIVGILLGIALTVGGVFAISVGTKNARAVVKYGNITLDEETVHYFSAYYKMLYLRELSMAGVDASDTEEFWSSVNKNGESYADDFKVSLREYIASIAVAANTYLDYSSYTPEDKLSVTMTCEQILQYRAEGDVSIFNTEAKKYGFNYNDFQNAAALLYKSRYAKSAMLGADGSAIANLHEECDRYLDTYSHVALIFIRDKTIPLSDSDGNYLYDEQGDIVLRDMTDEEITERLELIGDIRTEIASGDMTKDEFFAYLEKSDGDPEMRESGYYFHESAEETEKYHRIFPDLVDASLEMDIGECKELSYLTGVCFIYKYENDRGAYDDEESPFFSDFYPDAADYFYNSRIAELSADVTFKDSYDRIDALAIPVLREFYIREFITEKQ